MIKKNLTMNREIKSKCVRVQCFMFKSFSIELGDDYAYKKRGLKCKKHIKKGTIIPFDKTLVKTKDIVECVVSQPFKKLVKHSDCFSEYSYMIDENTFGIASPNPYFIENNDCVGQFINDVTCLDVNKDDTDAQIHNKIIKYLNETQYFINEGDINTVSFVHNSRRYAITIHDVQPNDFLHMSYGVAYWLNMNNVATTLPTDLPLLKYPNCVNQLINDFCSD